VSRLFVESLIQKQIPVRGALSYGEFYVDKKQGVFFGKALVEAYEVAESCNWLGFVLCPSATSRMEKELVCPIEKYNGYADLYKPWGIPKREAKKRDIGIEPGIACHLGISKKETKKLLQSLKTMKKLAGTTEQKMKYENTKKFLQKFSRSW
jgi:hypothetical protein